MRIPVHISSLVPSPHTTYLGGSFSLRQEFAQPGVVGSGDPDVVSGLEDEGSAQLLVFLVVEVERRHVENGVGIGGAGVDLDLHGASEQVINRSAAGSACSRPRHRPSDRHDAARV
jgi:hypothetical protein